MNPSKPSSSEAASTAGRESKDYEKVKNAVQAGLAVVRTGLIVHYCYGANCETCNELRRVDILREQEIVKEVLVALAGRESQAPERVRELPEKWRKRANAEDGNIPMPTDREIGYLCCADELEAALAIERESQPEPSDVQRAEHIYHELSDPARRATSKPDFVAVLCSHFKGIRAKPGAATQSAGGPAGEREELK